MTEQPAGPGLPLRPRAARPAVWPWLAGCIATGVAAGALWRLLVPVLVDGGDQEKAVAGDGVLALICLGAGLLVGVALTFAGSADWRRYLAAMAGSVAGAGVAWYTGHLLGAPKLGALGVPLLWPVVTSAAAFVSILVGGLTGSAAPGDGGGAPLGEPDQVLRPQLHVQAAAPGADQDGRVVERPGVEHGGQWPALSERADPADDVPR